MPETSGEVEIELNIPEDTVKRLAKLIQGEILRGSAGDICFTAVKRDGKVCISFEQEVTLEFDMADYAPEHDEP